MIIMKNTICVTAGILLVCLLSASCGRGQAQLQTTAPREQTTFSEQTTAASSPVNKILNEMTLEEKVGQLFLINPGMLNCDDSNTSITQELKEKIEKYNPGGFILFKPNIQTPEQTIKFIDDLKTASEYQPFIGVDEEGGTVSRIAANSEMGVERLPAMQKIGESGDPEKAYETGEALAGYLKRFHFNVDFAPVADVNTNPDNPVIGSRAFGSQPEPVAKMVAQAVKGLQDNNVVACVKHFPGHGDTSQDTHTGMAVVSHDMERLRSTELLPFYAGIEAGVDMVMVGHISLPNVTGTDEPAVVSHKIVTELLREEMSYDGVVITDSMAMDALYERYSLAEASVAALKAGVDILLMQMPGNTRPGTVFEEFDEAYRAVLEAVRSGEISETRLDASVRRILELKIKRKII